MNNLPAQGAGVNAVSPGILDYFVNSLPKKPYCTNELGSLFIRDKDKAIRHKYIQHNDPFDLFWLVYDVDRPTAHFDWQDNHCPAPNITAMNPENGHAHLFYGLDCPVIRCEYNPKVHKSPIRYAAAIDVALTKKLEADFGYAGLISKNPIHPHWNVNVWEPVPYELADLAGWLDLEPYRDQRVRLPPIGLGRNCTLFDVCRRWAYREVRRGGYLNMDFFIHACLIHVEGINNEFPCPLPYSEVKAIAKSIGKWVYQHFTADGFIECRRKKNRASQAVRKSTAAARNEKIREYKAKYKAATMRKIAAVFNCSLGTVSNALKGYI